MITTIRVIESQLFTEENKIYAKMAGLSTDTKPTQDIITGSTFLEADTGDTYAYSEEGTAWYKVS